jgi:hypothetical protein
MESARIKIMNRTLKFSIGLSLLLLLSVGLFLGIGYFQNPKYNHTISETMNVPSEQVWKYLIDVQDLPNRREEVVKVEIIEKDATNFPLVWKEITDMGGYLLFKRGITIPNQKIEFILAESSFKMLGTWTYTLEEKSGLTTVSITEDSEIASPLIRGVYFLAGRDSTLRQEMSIIRNYFKNLK